MEMDNSQKEILALSHASYRNVVIYELKDSFAFFLDLTFCKAGTLQEATDAIDTWHNQNIN